MDGSDGARDGPRKRALVAGGAGFPGSHLCARLLQDGFEVVAVDNLGTGSLRNLEPLMRLKAMSFVEHDITRPLDIRADRVRPRAPGRHGARPLAQVRCSPWR